MFEKEFIAAFSKVTASAEIRQEVMNMPNNTYSKIQHHSRKLIVLIAAVIALMAMTVTVCASEEITAWFEKYFAQQSDQPLSTEQIDYIHNNVQTFGESLTHNGYTLELKSAISDGRNAYVTVGITAPEAVTLLNSPPDEYDPGSVFVVLDQSYTPTFTNTSGNSCSGHSMLMEDQDGLANTMDLLFYLQTYDSESEDYPFSSEIRWTFYVNGLYAQYCDNVKLKELREKHKDEGGKHLIISGKEHQECYPLVPLVEECFEFTFYFDDTHFQEIEFVSDPVMVSSISTHTIEGEKTIENVSITSFKLRSLSATLLCDYAEGAPYFATNPERAIYAVMKDGSKVALVASHGCNGMQSFLAQSPIILENVDYILLADGTKLPAPETK